MKVLRGVVVMNFIGTEDWNWSEPLRELADWLEQNPDATLLGISTDGHDPDESNYCEVTAIVDGPLEADL